MTMKKVFTKKMMLLAAMMLLGASTTMADDVLTTAFSNDGSTTPSEWTKLSGGDGKNKNRWNSSAGYTGNCLEVEGAGYIDLSAYSTAVSSGEYYQLDFYARISKGTNGQLAVYTSEAETPTTTRLTTDVCMFEMSYSGAEPEGYDGADAWDTANMLSASVMGTSIGRIAHEGEINGYYHHIIIKVTDRNVEYQIVSPKDEEVEYASTLTLAEGVQLGGIYYNVSKARLDDFTLASKPSAEAVNASIVWDGLKLNGGKYYDSYVLTVTKGGISTSDYTVTLPAGAKYAVSEGILTYNGQAEATTLTVNAGGTTADVEVPAGNVYVKAVSYDLTDADAFLNLPTSYSPADKTAVNGFSDQDYRYAYTRGARMLQNGLYYASSDQALLFPGYGITSAKGFNVQFMEHQDGFVYGYVKRIANSAAYADATVTTQWSKSASTALDARGISIYSGLDVYVPEDATISISTGDAGYATFSSVLPLSFTAGEAYILKEGTGDALQATKLTKTASQTALLIKGDATASILAADEATDDATGNLLQPQLFQNGSYTLSQGEAPKSNYVLGMQNEQVAFYWIGENSATIAYGKAWLTVEDGAAEARTLRVSFDDELPTGIETMDIEHSTLNLEHYYDLQGRRVESSMLKKGLYISNGKKYMVK